MQAREGAQSVLWIHSGRQLGGFPIKPPRQAQLAWPFASLHKLFGPHGEGSHGLLAGTVKFKYC